MAKFNLLSYAPFILFLLLLLIFPNECISAGKSGLLLWFNVIIPTLFPFMMLSYIILNSPIIEGISKIFSPIFKLFFGVSGVASYALIMGLLSGYPMGALIVNDLVQTNRLSKREGSYLLTFCNNPSPMFVIGFIATSLLGNAKIGIPMLLSIYFGNLITAMLFKRSHNTSITVWKPVAHNTYKLSFAYFDECIAQTAEVLLKVGGYIILFSIPTVLLSQLPFYSIAYTFLISTFDLSNGVHLLVNTHCSDLLKYALISSLCAFGSFSVVGQTASVIKSSGLPLRKYFFSKLINGAVTFACAILVFEMFLQK